MPLDTSLDGVLGSIGSNHIAHLASGGSKLTIHLKEEDRVIQLLSTLSPPKVRLNILPSIPSLPRGTRRSIGVWEDDLNNYFSLSHAHSIR